MRRDTVLVQPNGHVILRFRTDNPGVWVFHCHIEWHVASGLIATFIEAPLEIQTALSGKIPQEHFDLCERNHPPIKTSGNAAGNDVDFLDLTGEPAPPEPLPEGFTTKGVFALVVSVVNGLVMVAAIAWYGMSQATDAESGTGSAHTPEGEQQPLLAATQPTAEQRDE
jgi:iron transport multicopper oxidase